MNAALATVLLFGSQANAQTQGPPAAPASDATRIKVDVSLMVLHLSVTDRQGRAYRGLTAENFRVFDNGAEQAVHHFTTEDLPFTMGMVLDRSGSMAMMIDDVYQAAFHAAKASKEKDEFFVLTFNDEIQLRQEFSRDRQLLQKRLKGVSAEGRTALFDAILTGVEHIRRGTHDKKALLVVTDGADNSSHISFEELLTQLRRAEVAVNVVGMFGEGKEIIPRLDSRDYVKQLEEIARVTGGKAYFPRTMKECEEACIAIAEDLRQQYALGYYPAPRKNDGSWHPVQVQLQLPSDLSEKGITARTRSGYFAPPPQ